MIEQDDHVDDERASIDNRVFELALYCDSCLEIQREKNKHISSSQR